ncbi:MAG: hypothetical protein OEM07_05255, partial [Gammaproteobacteria bacterium]|nr:hypothetical protein [Gammaproteobacteria bacterium]
MKKSRCIKYLSVVWLISGQSMAVQDKLNTAQYYSDSHGSEVLFPMGELSFADEVVLYQVGDPAPLKA